MNTALFVNGVPFRRRAERTRSSSSSNPVIWMCTVSGECAPPEDLRGVTAYAVQARKSPLHAFDGNPPPLCIPQVLGEDRIPSGSVLFARRIYHTLTLGDGSHRLVQYFLPVHNPYLI